jgi:hypothetical protein
LLLIGCILCLLFLFALVRVDGSGHCSTLKNRGDVGFREQNASANSSVLDAVIANDSPERLGANLKHLCRILGGVDFHVSKFDCNRVFNQG